MRFTEQLGTGTAGGSATSIDDIISTRRGNAASWTTMIGKTPVGEWELALPNTDEMRNRFRDEDILFVLTCAGMTPNELANIIENYPEMAYQAPHQQAFCELAAYAKLLLSTSSMCVIQRYNTNTAGAGERLLSRFLEHYGIVVSQQSQHMAGITVFKQILIR